MKLVLDGTVVTPPYSGVQLAVKNQLLALFETSTPPDTSVFCNDPEIRRAAERSGIDTACTRTWYQSAATRIAWQQLILPGILKRQGASLLHAFAYTAPLACPVPYILNVHDIIALEHPELCSFLNARHMKALLPGSIRNAAACIVSAGYVADQLTHRFDIPPSRIHRVPLGVDYEFFSNPAPHPSCLPFNDGRPYLLFVGNIEPKKGLGTLIFALDEIGLELDCDIILAGRCAWKSGRLMKLINAYSSYTGLDRTHILGPVPQSELPGLYQRAWAFVFPSVTEGFGLPVLEAMAAGIPVIHSDHPVLMETAGGAGLPFPVGDADQLGQALLCLKESRDMRQEMICEGRKHAQHFPWSRWGKSAAEIHEKVLDGMRD